jgi:broad specificity phosphatase PhoE
MGRWYLVRHGQTAWNAEGRVQGHTDTPLGEKGLAQAQRVAARLRGQSFAAAYASDLRRAADTARVILDGRTLPLQMMPELREAHHGQWDGMTYAEVQSRYPDGWARLTRMAEDVAAPGGETAAQVAQRVKAACDRIAAANGAGQDVLIVAHSGSLRAMAIVLLGLPVSASWRLRLDPASLSIIAVHERGATLDLWNDSSHLERPDGR